MKSHYKKLLTYQNFLAAEFGVTTTSFLQYIKSVSDGLVVKKMLFRSKGGNSKLLPYE